MRTDQELFDTVVRHLRKQGKAAKMGEDEDGLCAYRTERGLKCAIGCLIPDNNYSNNFEGFSIGDNFSDDRDAAVAQEILDAADIGEHQLRLAKALQFVHDCRDPSEWKMWWRAVADIFELSPRAVSDPVEGALI